MTRLLLMQYLHHWVLNWNCMLPAFSVTTSNRIVLLALVRLHSHCVIDLLSNPHSCEPHLHYMLCTAHISFIWGRTLL